MTKIQFVTAAKESIEEEAAEAKVLEFGIAGQNFVCDLPNSAQASLLMIASQAGTVAETTATALEILETLLHGSGYARLRKLMARGVIDFNLLLWGDELNEEGIVSSLMKEVSGGRPTQPSSDSASSPQSAGRKSTGRSPGKGSTRSGSPSTAS